MAIVPNLWFDTQALEAAEFYCAVFPDGRILRVSHYGDAAPSKKGQVLTVDFEIDGQRVTALNGGPEFRFNEAVSLLVECEGQEEVDFYWDRLAGDGGTEVACGWVRDKYGLSWQIVPKLLAELLTDPDEARRDRAMAAMMEMVKLDVEELRRAADGAPVS